MSREELREQIQVFKSMDPSQKEKEAAMLSILVVPAYLIQLLKEAGYPTHTILDLGCGCVNPVAYTLDKPPTARTVYLQDPNADPEQMPEEIWGYKGIQRPNIIINSQNCPKGLPAIAMHPGFATDHNELHEAYKDLRDEEARGYRNPMPQWYETISQLEPSVIAFSAYTDQELIQDILYLGHYPNPKYYFHSHHKNPFFRQKFRWGRESAGFGWAMAVVKPQRDNDGPHQPRQQRPQR